MINKLPKNKTARDQGFTLIELLVVIGILTVLLAIVLIAINPGRQFSQANNTKRRSDVNAILNAVHQYSADNQGDLSTINGGSGTLPATATDVADSGADICDALVPTYIAELPTDPTDGTEFSSCTTYSADYQISIGAGNRITVSAPAAELGETISVTR
ncbi:MAG: type II secretion system protein [Patescibacteria group bacterium]|uniref:Type II secretion system protein n=1 Tax=candidate division WWE3 bacterium TaxID=2053526 RepID=A0A955ECC5_UNCKA|nr:type II secretion system protein [candidate division WWE3 bacterium]